MPSRRRRQEVDFVTRGQRNHLFRLLLFHRMDGLEQIVKPSGGRNPEEALHRLIGLVEDAVWNIHRHPDEIARLRDGILAVQEEIKTSFEKVNEFVLRRMDMWRNECLWRKRCMPGKRAL